jgi:hypothetical protein
MVTGGSAVIVLLIVIMLLVVEKQEDRPGTLGTILVGGAILIAIVKIVPFVLGILVVTGTLAFDYLGWRTLLILLCVCIAARLGRLRWLDHKDNQAIRAGSQEAFDERVRVYERTFGYSKEKAIEATQRIKDERRRTYTIRIKRS